jgi:hypothetical protein
MAYLMTQALAQARPTKRQRVQSSVNNELERLQLHLPKRTDENQRKTYIRTVDVWAGVRSHELLSGAVLLSTQ